MTNTIVFDTRKPAFWERVRQEFSYQESHNPVENKIAQRGLWAESESPETGVTAAAREASSTSATHLSIAKSYLNYYERDNDEAAALSQFFKANIGVSIDPARTAWCAAFANAVLAAGGLEHTSKLNARSFLDAGKEITKDELRPGDIVVFWRVSPRSWQGHVGFFVGWAPDGRMRILGGNQHNKVLINRYNDERVIGYRRVEAA